MKYALPVTVAVLSLLGALQIVAEDDPPEQAYVCAQNLSTSEYLKLDIGDQRCPTSPPPAITHAIPPKDPKVRVFPRLADVHPQAAAILADSLQPSRTDLSVGWNTAIPAGAVLIYQATPDAAIIAQTIRPPVSKMLLEDIEAGHVPDISLYCASNALERLKEQRPLQPPR